MSIQELEQHQARVNLLYTEQKILSDLATEKYQQWFRESLALDQALREHNEELKAVEVGK